jgi:hypothetical protein
MTRRKTVTREVPEIEKALDSLVTALIQHREQRETSEGNETAIVLPEIHSLDFSTPVRTRLECALESILKNPIEGAICFTIRELGEHLYRIGGTALMRDVLERVADRDPSHYHYRGALIDRKWDCIGLTPDSKDIWAA